LGAGKVSVTAVNSGGSDLLSDGTIFVEFTGYKGNPSQLKSSSKLCQIYVDIEVGGLPGLFPLDGSFVLDHDNEFTKSISVTASASELKAALEELYSIGRVSVIKDGYGIATAYDGTTMLYGDDPSIFSIWVIKFDGTKICFCSQ
jgi:hypothetical protein